MPSRHQIEPLTLVAIARLQEDAYGVTIHEEIERITARHASLAGVYSALDRMERDGLVRSFHSEPRSERGGRARRHYALTASGRELVRREREMSVRMWQGVVEGAPGRKR